MKSLTPEAYGRAREYLKTQARPVERALFERFFEGGPLEWVAAALMPYQNADGGFGHALEPDLRTPTSSALATGHALSRLKEAGAPADHSMARRAAAYALATLDPQSHIWRIVPPDANEYPHAPWWHDQDGSLARTFEDFRVSPRGEILAGLYHFGAELPEGKLDELSAETTAAVEAGAPSGGSFEYALQLAEAPGLPPALRERLQAHLRAHTAQAVEQDPRKWGDYCLPPLWAAPSPDSPVADLLAESLPKHLDYLIETQAPEGFWEPNWSWFGAYPQVWPQAQKEWRGELTLRNLRYLQSFGRLE